MSTIRIKLKILPYQEKLCILANENCTINDLKGKVFHAIQFYSVYKSYLEFCSIHLEIQINNEVYAIPSHYTLKDAINDNDTIIASFVDNKDLQNRQSVHLKYQTEHDIKQKQARPVYPNYTQNIQNIQPMASMPPMHSPQPMLPSPTIAEQKNV